MNIARMVLLIAISAVCTAANAGLRCDGDIADIGDSKAAVIMKCADPFFVETICKPAVGPFLVESSSAGPGPNIRGCFPVEAWSYNPGSGSFLTIMWFENDVLTSILYGPRIP